MIQKNLVHHSKSPAMQARVICHASTAWHSSALHLCSGRSQPFTVSLIVLHSIAGPLGADVSGTALLQMPLTDMCHVCEASQIA